MRRARQYAQPAVIALSNKVDLKIDWATHEAAKYACEKWHYSKRIPVNKLVRLGVWEDKSFRGVVIFGVGASATLHKQFGLQHTEVCELVRVALTTHQTPVSRILKIALKMLLKSNPKLKVVVSFADTNENHHGGIYQAGGWVYTGLSEPTKEYFYNGSWRHATDVYKRLPSNAIKQLRKRSKPGKHRYIFLFDYSLSEMIEKRRKPYPKRVVSKEIVAPVYQTGEGGVTPTTALHPTSSE